MTKNRLHKVIIWGADNYNTLGLLRSLGKFNLHLILLLRGKRGCAASASKYCNHIRETASNEEAVEYLIENFPETDILEERSILIPGGDAASKAIAEYYDCLSRKFHLMTTSDPTVLLRVTDKNEMARVARMAGFIVPDSQEYRVGMTDFVVPFPVIIKPVKSQGRIEFKTKIFDTKEELLSFSKYLNQDNIYVMQKLVQRSHDIVVYGCRLPDGRTVLAGHHTLERWSDDGGGSYGHLSPEIPEYLKPQAISKFLEIIDYHGLFSAEFGFENGTAYFYEFNLRNDGFCHLSYQAGANLPLLWVNECLNLGLCVPEKMTKAIVGINEIYDIANVFRHNISYKKYKQDLREAEAFHFYDEEDRKPYENMRRRMFWEIPMRATLRWARPYVIWLLNLFAK